MRRLVFIAALIAPVPGLADAQSVEGLWRTEAVKNGAYLDVRVAPCGEAMCGSIEAAHNTTRDGLVGSRLIEGMVPESDGSWGSGTIIAPDTEKTYRGSMWLEGDGLKVQGCIALICRSQTWTRLE